MSNKPTVSILLLCMNHAKYIAKCIESIAAQTYHNIEVIFLDNASTDNSAEIFLTEIKKSSLKYAHIQNTVSEPITVNLNKMLALAKGEFVTPFSTDDWMCYNNLEQKVNAFSTDQNIGAVLGNGYYYYEESESIVENNPQSLKKYISPKELLLEPTSYFWCGPLYKTHIVKELGGWDEDLLIEDLDMNLRVALKYKIMQLHNPLVYYRKHPTAYTRDPIKIFNGFKLYYKKYKKHPDIPIKQWYNDLHINTGNNLMAKSRRKAAYFYVASLQYGFKREPFRKLKFIFRKALGV